MPVPATPWIAVLYKLLQYVCAFNSKRSMKTSLKHSEMIARYRIYLEMN